MVVSFFKSLCVFIFDVVLLGYNLGVSCINIGCYKEAAEHFLRALSMHKTGHQANISNNLWDTLRRTFVLVYFLEIAN